MLVFKPAPIFMNIEGQQLQQEPTANIMYIMKQPSQEPCQQQQQAFLAEAARPGTCGPFVSRLKLFPVLQQHPSVSKQLSQSYDDKDQSLRPVQAADAPALLKEVHVIGPVPPSTEIKQIHLVEPITPNPPLPQSFQTVDQFLESNLDPKDHEGLQQEINLKSSQFIQQAYAPYNQGLQHIVKAERITTEESLESQQLQWGIMNDLCTNNNFESNQCVEQHSQILIKSVKLMKTVSIWGWYIHHNYAFFSKF